MPGGGAVSIRQRRHGVFPGQDRHRLPFAADDAAEDPGLAELDRGVVDQVAGLEVVGAVQDQVGVAHQVEDVGVVDVGDDRLDLDRAVDQPQLPRGGLGLGEIVGDVLLVEEDLALEVVGLDEVAVDDADATRRRPAPGGWPAPCPSAPQPQSVTRLASSARWPASPSEGSGPAAVAIERVGGRRALSLEASLADDHHFEPSVQIVRVNLRPRRE